MLFLVCVFLSLAWQKALETDKGKEERKKHQRDMFVGGGGVGGAATPLCIFATCDGALLRSIFLVNCADTVYIIYME